MNNLSKTWAESQRLGTPLGEKEIRMLEVNNQYHLLSQVYNMLLSVRSQGVPLEEVVDKVDKMLDTLNTEYSQLEGKE